MPTTARTAMPESSACSEESKLRALQEVLSSSTFERAELLKRFLRYVCEMEFAGRLDEINEYKIGIEALGRPASYSPGEDSSVRSRAHAVREKLAAYYDGEGAEARVRIEFHKGSYIPHFVPVREQAADVLPAPVVEGPADIAPAETARPRRATNRSFIVGLLAGATLAAFAAVRFFPPGAPDRAVAPILKDFWGPLVESGSDVIISLATAPSMLLHSYQGDTLPPTARITPAPDEVAKWYAGLQMQDGGGRLYSQPTMNTTLFGDSVAATVAVKVLTARGKSVQVLPEYTVHPLALRGRDVLAIGSPNYSPMAARILRDAPFSVTYDPATRLEVVSTANGQPSQARFSAERNQAMSLKVAYGLITVLPSPGPGDENHRIVLFSGISSAGTQAAVELFSSATALKSLRLAMHIAEGGHPPPSYQVVVRCAVVNTLALDWSYVTHRIIQQPPVIN